MFKEDKSVLNIDKSSVNESKQHKIDQIILNSYYEYFLLLIIIPHNIKIYYLKKSRNIAK